MQGCMNVFSCMVCCVLRFETKFDLYSNLLMQFTSQMQIHWWCHLSFTAVESRLFQKEKESSTNRKECMPDVDRNVSVIFLHTNAQNIDQ